MLLTYYMWIKAVKTGSIYWAAMCALAYFYMVSIPCPGTQVSDKSGFLAAGAVQCPFWGEHMIPGEQNLLLDPTVQPVQPWNWCFSFFSSQVSSWGGYVFLINLIPLHVLVLMLTGRFSHRIYVAYCTVYCLGTILSMQISFVGFQVRPSSTACVSRNLGSSIFREGTAHTSTHLHAAGNVVGVFKRSSCLFLTFSVLVWGIQVLWTWELR